MKVSTTSRATLVALLTVGMFASFSALAQYGPNRNSGHQARHASPPPAHQANHRPPSPPPHQAGHRPPPPPPHQADHRPPPHIVHIDHRSNWRRGRVLPRNVIYHNVPPERIYAYALPPPPSGHRYVRVANDILLIAIGTGLIVDAIQDISYR